MTDPISDGVSPGAINFNISNDFQEPPIVPAGAYRGTIMQIAWDEDNQKIDWGILTEGNGGFCHRLNKDGLFDETDIPVDGRTVYFSSWFPFGDDATEKARDGVTTKAQNKINMLGRLCRSLKIQMGDIQQIKQSIADGAWMEIPVTFKVKQDEYDGNITFKVNPFSVKRA